MKIKYYIIPVGDKNTDSSLKSLITYQEVTDKDVRILRPDDISQIFMVPYFQDYNGLALVITSDNILNQNIDISSFITNDNTMVFNTEKTIFVINCDSPLLKNAFSPRTLVSVDLNQFLSFQNIGNINDWIVDSSLCNYFNCTIKHELINNQAVNSIINQEDEVIELTFDDIIESSNDKDTDVFEG